MTITTDALSKGAKAVFSKKKQYVVIKVLKMYTSEELPTIKRLATDFRLSPGAVLDALLNLGSNVDALQTLFDQQVQEAIPIFATEAETLKFLRTKLAKVAALHKPSANGKTELATALPYEDWIVIPEGEPLITLPVSRGFSPLLQKSESVRLEREIQIRISKLDFIQLRLDLNSLRFRAQVLGSDLRTLESIVAPILKEVSMLDAAQKMMAVMFSLPKAPLLPPTSVQGQALNNKRLLDDLATKTNRHLLAQSALQRVIDQKAEVAKSTAALRKALDGITDGIRFYRANVNIAPPEVHADVEEVLTEAYVTLLDSPSAEQVVRDEIFPLIQLVASLGLPSDVGDKIKDPDFKRGLTEAPPAPAENNAALILGGMILALGPQALGNVKGPYSFSVAVAAAAELSMHAVVKGGPSGVRALGGLLLRFATITGGFNGQTFGQVVTAVENNNLRDLTKLDWARHAQAGPRVSSFISLLYFAVFLKNHVDSIPQTLKEYSDLAATLTGATLNVVQTLDHINSFAKATASYAKVLATNFIVRLACLASAASAVSTMVSEFGAGDLKGVTIAGLGFAGGLLSAAGFFFGTGVAADASIVGIPLGTAMQLVGSALGIIATVLSTVKDATQAGAFRVMEGILDELSKSDSFFQQAAKVRPELQDALTQLSDAIDDSHFWDIEATDPTMLMLLDIGFQVPHIAAMVDEDKLFVKAHLPADRT